jgi:hypothetical protein
LCPARLTRIAAEAPEPGAIVVGDEVVDIGITLLDCLEQAGPKRTVRREPM